MKVSEVASLPFRAGSALRHARVFHPDGVLCAGSMVRLAAEGEGLPVTNGDVIGRLSKGVGTPRGLPDFAGLAWRAQSPGAGRPWDILMVSANARVLLRPTTSWTAAEFSTLMPFGYRGDVFWLRARLTSPTTLPGLELDTVRQHLASNPMVFAVEQARGRGEFTPLATLEFNRELESAWPPEDVAFDPTLNTAPEVSLLPQWLTAVRRRAYRSSRQGRHVE
ncbi:phosphodiesterase [[Mycobacterium] burgundiense]|jgi:hypothetical protein|uniref:Phosphodiesterase n=1 Tax=[Mycobacterium] burgundiense TaxID=3064286 RepID=A0ABZ3JDA0_9MYCO|nr:phosphodiesterase [Mycolicibacterium sp. MU0053]CAJ1510648.1 phosphodiesterase [Mycolicibacterium sp. MU0053]